MSVNEKTVDLHENGLFFNEKYMPEELLSKIFCYCDHKTLLSCQLVCKYWQCLIKDFVWRKKVEQTMGSTFPIVKEIPWVDYYFICDEKPFNKNLIKNHSGESGNTDHWRVIIQGGDNWAVQSPPSGPSLPNDPIFKDINSCFVTSWSNASKYQTIDLIREGFSEYILDYLQPTIKISEWYCCRWDCPALYECGIALLKTDKKTDEAANLIKEYTFRRQLDNEFRDQWFQFTNEFKNYGPGLRKIVFIHGGRDEQYWAGHYGAKMAGACIKLEISKNITTADLTNEESTEKISFNSFLANMVTTNPGHFYSLYSRRPRFILRRQRVR